MKMKTKLCEGVILSTVSVEFINWYGDYETAITFDNQQTWRIIEGYKSEEDAVEGHMKYENMSIGRLKNIRYIG